MPILNYVLALNGNITADYHVDLGLQGTFDTGMINFIGLGIPGLSIPGYDPHP
jgi:hypothetical protein